MDALGLMLAIIGMSVAAITGFFIAGFSRKKV